jgi:hypothetical protein
MDLAPGHVHLRRRLASLVGRGLGFRAPNLIEMKSLQLILGSLAAALTLQLVTAQTTPADPAPAPVKPTKAEKKADKTKKQDKDKSKEKGAAAKKSKAAKLNHVVAFKFKEDARKEDIRKVEEAFRALKAKIPQVQKLVWGLNNSPEGLNKGCTHVWILSFNSEDDRNVYLTHPDHQEFGKLVKPLLADVFVADFWAKD